MLSEGGVREGSLEDLNERGSRLIYFKDAPVLYKSPIMTSLHTTVDTRPVAKGYIRVSTKMQVETGVSLETQKQQIENYCKFRNLNLTEFYIDAGISGTNPDRPSLNRLLDGIEKGDRVIVCDLTRLSRDTLHALTVLKTIKEKEAFFVCLSPEFDYSTPTGELVGTILFAVATLDVRKISETVSNNMQRISREGKLRTKPGYGYRFVSKNKDYEPVPEQQQVIEYIKTLYRAGLKLSHISDRLNKEGWNKTLGLNRPTPRWTPDQLFYPQTVKNILIDHGLIQPKGSSSGRKPLEQRIVTQHKPIVEVVGGNQ